MSSAADVGLNCQADFANAAILFQQPHREQAIKWYYGKRAKGKPHTEATLIVSKETGDLTFKGGDARFSGSIVAKGLSADKKAARNLRGKNLTVKRKWTPTMPFFLSRTGSPTGRSPTRPPRDSP